MVKHDYKNLNIKRRKIFDGCPRISLHSKVVISAAAVVMTIGMMFGVAESNVAEQDIDIPIKMVPYTVHDFSFGADEYPGKKIPSSINVKYKKELRCMARNLYFESRDQELQGRLAVGLVTLNRVNSKNFPNSICEVVWQKRWSKRYGKWVAQFSWTLDGKSDTPIEKSAYEEAVRLASALLAGGIQDFTKGADHYHADWMKKYPRWAKKLILVAQIDDHIFYQEPSRLN